MKFHILVITCLGLLFLNCSESTSTMATDSEPVNTMPYTHIGDTILPVSQWQDYNYNFIKIDPSGTITDSMTNFKIHIEQYTKSDLASQLSRPELDKPNIYLFSMLNPQKGNIILWKGDEVQEDSMGIYIIGTYDYDILNTTLRTDTVFWLPQNPTDSSREISPGQTITYLGNNHEYVITPQYSENIIIEKAMLFEERYVNPNLSEEQQIEYLKYYYLKKGVGILGWEFYQDSILTDMSTLTNMNYDYPY